MIKLTINGMCMTEKAGRMSTVINSLIEDNSEFEPIVINIPFKNELVKQVIDYCESNEDSITNELELVKVADYLGINALIDLCISIMAEKLKSFQSIDDINNYILIK
jgi:hypothetical protein